MRSRYYDRQTKPISMDHWIGLFERDDRQVGNDRVGEAQVSTVYLGLDHSLGDGPPLIFESMIFGGEHDEDQWRYSTEAEAREGHARILTALREGRQP